MVSGWEQFSKSVSEAMRVSEPIRLSGTLRVAGTAFVGTAFIGTALSRSTCGANSRGAGTAVTASAEFEFAIFSLDIVRPTDSFAEASYSKSSIDDKRYGAISEKSSEVN